jgi:SAM-dependent methyltransferase
MFLGLQTRILGLLAKQPGEPEGGATENYTYVNCLDFVRRTVPDFDRRIRGKSVLDYGCGHGWQAVAMQSQCGAASVFGFDVNPGHLAFGETLARKYQCSAVSFGRDVDGLFDAVVSIGGLEHYPDPEAALARMKRHVKADGEIIIAFAAPWYSPLGSHFSGYTRFPGTRIPVPWLNLFFSEAALLELRTRFRRDHPAHLEEIQGGLNRMTISRFERMIRDCGLRVEWLHLFATKNLPFITRVPGFRELLTSAVSCVLRPRGV